MLDNIDRVRMATILGEEDNNFIGVDVLMQEIRSRGGSLLYIVKPGVDHQDEAYYNSPEFMADYRTCNNYVLGITSVEHATLPEGMEITMFPSPVSNTLQFSVTTDRAMDPSADQLAVTLTSRSQRIGVNAQPCQSVVGGPMQALTTDTVYGIRPALHNHLILVHILYDTKSVRTRATLQPDASYLSSYSSPAAPMTSP